MRLGRLFGRRGGWRRSWRQGCTSTGASIPAVGTEVLADRDELFTQPFTLR